MGQYFRKRLVRDGLIAENEQPKEGEIRFYANSLQRTIATAQYFSSGMLPIANVPIEHHAALGTMDPVFNMRFTFMNDGYHAAAVKQIAAMGGKDGLQGIDRSLDESYRIIDEVLDFKSHPAVKKNVDEGMPKGPFNVILKNGSSPYSVNYRKAEYLASDALVLQYYEEPDAQKAAFNHKLTQKDWQAVSNVKDTGIEVLCSAPLVAVNIAHPLLQVMKDELSSIIGNSPSSADMIPTWPLCWPPFRLLPIRCPRALNGTRRLAQNSLLRNGMAETARITPH